MGAQIVHQVDGGSCVVCGDTEEWLRERHGDAAVEVVPPAYTPRRSPAPIVEPAASHGLDVWALIREQYPPRPARGAAARARRGRGTSAYAGPAFGFHRDSHGVISAGVDRFPLRVR